MHTSQSAVIHTYTEKKREQIFQVTLLKANLVKGGIQKQFKET